MEGKRVTVNVKHSEWNGEQQAEHQGPLRAPTGGAQEVTSFPPVVDAAIENAISVGGYATDPGF